jgi:hypothetical protein
MLNGDNGTTICSQNFASHIFFSLTPAFSKNPAQPATPVLFWWLVGTCIAVALVPTLWTALDLAGAALFYGKSAVLNANDWWWVQLINLYIPAAFRTLMLLALRNGDCHWRLSHGKPCALAKRCAVDRAYYPSVQLGSVEMFAVGL